MPEVRLIDKQAALKSMCETCRYCEKLQNRMRETHPDFVTDKCNMYKFIAEQPTIEAEPVRHGRWDEIQCFSEHGIEMASYECTSCGNEIERQRGLVPPYCEFCGAKMDGGAENG
jgi:hypothetical protein